MQQDLSLIKNLQLFNKATKEDLEEILKHSHIKKVAKDTPLFWEGDKALEFQIILEGWVKLFNIDDSGCESVVKIIGSDNVVDSNSVFLNTAHLLNAQTIEDCRILSISTQFITSYIKTNLNLANNILLSLAQQNQDLSHQSGIISSRSSEEKVGWFLLDSLLEDGEKNSQGKLPYDKMSIAAKLQMTPETFSRSLKLFKKNNNIQIDKNSITLLNPSALCEYCDRKTALKCNKFHKNECSHISN